MFRNDNNRITKSMSRSSIKASKFRNIFVAFAIALATCMIMVVALYFIGTRQQAKNDAIGRYQAALVNVSEEIITNLSSNENIENIGMTYFLDTLNIEDYKLTVMYMDDNIMQLNKYPDLEGSLPEAQDEVVVAADYLTHIKSSDGIGDKITLTIGGSESKYTISGILPLESSGRSFTIITSKALLVSLDNNPLYSAYFRIKGSDSMSSDVLKAEISQIASNAGIGGNYVVYSSYYFALIEQQTTQDIGIIIGVCALVALVCALVIYNLFYISVIGKTNEYGRLRIIGTTQKQIKKIVFREGIYLSCIAIPSGIILGSIIGYILAPGGWNIITTMSIAFITSFSVYLMVVLATHKPIKLASKITPLEAMRHTSYADSIKAAATKRLHRSITPSRLAYMNLTRNKKKAVLTISSLGVCGILLMSSSAYLNSIDFDDMARKNFPYGELIIELGVGGSESYGQKEYLELQRQNLLSNELLETIRLLDGVENIKEYSGLVIDTTIPSGYTEPFTLDGYTENDIDLFESNLVAGTVNYETLATSNGIVVSNMNEWEELYGWNVQLGDILYVEDSSGNLVELQVMGLVDSSIRYGGFNLLFIPDVVLQKLQSKVSNLNYQIVVNTTEEKTDFVEEAIYELISSNPDLDISTLKDIAATYRSDLEIQKKPIYILTVFIGVFGIINLLNTLITNILVRKTELSVFQALGLSSRQLSKMLFIEGLTYSFGTILITLTIGTGCGYLLCKFFNTIGVFGTVTYHFPIWQIAIYFTILLSLQITFSFMSIKLFRQQSLVERIKDI